MTSIVTCIYCSIPSNKNGKTNNAQQRYRCTKCNKSFLTKYKYNAYSPTINNQLQTLLIEGCGIRSISRILRISLSTVLKRIRLIAAAIKKPIIALGIEYELDELCTFMSLLLNMQKFKYGTVITFGGAVVGTVFCETGVGLATGAYLMELGGNIELTGLTMDASGCIIQGDAKGLLFDATTYGVGKVMKSAKGLVGDAAKVEAKSAGGTALEAASKSVEEGADKVIEVIKDKSEKKEDTGKKDQEKKVDEKTTQKTLK